MAKWKRSVVGSVCKDPKDNSKSYIKFSQDVSFKKGDTVNLESAKDQLTNLESAMESGKISEDFGEKIKERIGRIPDWVRFEIVKVFKTDE